ncbi:GNAT family N-acetyltransferase, partial [Bacteriovorax sp. DB6_IX]|uniref:GNAT family N-acetyltransferase n=1 Tax=Bacteriovorax sp. DB6_IX TaxID=1353530 RepID=UPI00038A2741
AYEKYSHKYEFIRDSKGNILGKDDVNKVFGYYLVVNTVFQTISSLSNSEQYLEKLLLTDFRTFLFSLRAEFKDDFLDYLLESEELYQKGNMRCCIESLNENTIDSPWKIYNKIPNPLKALRQLNMGRTGYLYQYDLGYSKLSLRTLEESDLEIFYKWHHQDFVKEFWELDVSKEELLKYIRNLKASPYQLPLILEKDSMAVGYFEAYWAFDDRIAPYCGAEVYDRGIHLLFGEQKVLRSRFVYDGILHATKFLLEDDQRTERVWGEPRSDNKKILKFAEKLPGWRFIKEFDFPHKRSALIVCEKELFFKEYNGGALL